MKLKDNGRGKEHSFVAPREGTLIYACVVEYRGQRKGKWLWHMVLTLTQETKEAVVICVIRFHGQKTEKTVISN